MQLTLEQMAARVVAGASDAILFADREGILRLWNRGAEEMFGWSAAEAVGKSMDLIIPERLRARHWEGWRRVMETGVTRSARTCSPCPPPGRTGRRSRSSSRSSSFATTPAGSSVPRRSSAT